MVLSESELLINEETGKKEDSKIGWREYFLAFDLILISYFAQATIAMPLTFFSRIVVNDRNDSLTSAAVVLQSSPAASAVVCTFFGRYLHTLAPKHTVIIGVVIEATSSIAFGFINFFESNMAFAVVGTLLRMMAGAGNAAVRTSILVIAVNNFPGKSNFMLGLLESAMALAYLTGGVFGVLLYNVYNSMVLPYVATGFCYLFSAARFSFCFKSKKENSAPVTNTHIWNTLKNPRIFVILLLFGSTSGIVAYLEVTLTLFWNNFNILIVAKITLVMSLLFMVTTACSGMLVDKHRKLRYVAVVVGSFGVGTSVIVATFVSQLWRFYIIFSGFGISAAMVVIGCYSDNLITAEKHFQTSDKIAVKKSLSGLWSTVAYLGRFLCPIIASQVEYATNSVSISYVGFGSYFYFLTFISVITFLLGRYGKSKS